MCKRAALLFFAFNLVIGVLAARLVIINLGGDTAASHTSNGISASAATSRGCIYDCNLVELVNTSRENIIAVRPSLDSLSAVSYAIDRNDKNAAYITVQKKKIAFARATENINSADAVTFGKIIRYSDDGLCVHLVGYVDGAGEGVCGIEKYYNNILTNASGTLRVRCDVDARGNVLEGGEIKTVSENYDSKAGVALTIDSRVQQICEDALKAFSIEKGAVVVLDTSTSQIRAMASVPEFSQNNVAASLDDSNAPFINRAITPYSVGSVFKAVVAAAAVEKGIPTSTKYNCTGEITIGSSSFGCHKHDGHGTLDMFGGMAQSCNPYFINLAVMTGKESICDMGANLGLGSSVELADGWNTDAGIMPDAQSLVSQQDLANLAFGQGKLMASPLQMAAVYAAIANNGVYTAPSLMQSVIDSDRTELMRAELPTARRVMSVQTAQTVQQLLYQTVQTGSGSKAKPDGIEVAGKTATAQSGQFDESGNEITQSWFCGYFPYEEPRYAVTVLKENGTGGSADCAPVFKYIAGRISSEVS